MTQDTIRPRLSIVVPFYNEEESVELLCRRTIAAVEPLGIPFELILVDDGSSDRTFVVANSVAEGDHRIRVIKFRANFGQTPAMAAGIDFARGEVIVTMDGDLQNDPLDIKVLLTGIDQGNDLVVGWRYNRQDKLLTRKLPSMIANWLIGKVTGIPIRDNGCSLKAFRADMIKSLPLYSEMHRFIPAMASIAGPKILQVKVRHHARQFGESKYGLSRVYRVLLDLLIVKTVTSSTERPLLWFCLLALPAVLFGLILLIVGALPVGLAASPAVPLVGSGVLFLALALFLVFGGALAELILQTSSVRPRHLAVLMAKELSASRSIRSNPP